MAGLDGLAGDATLSNYLDHAAEYHRIFGTFSKSRRGHDRV
jgi:hypothetical protein